MVNLDALANDLRALDIESTFEGEFLQIGELPGVVRVISDGSLWFSGQCTADFAGIIIPAVARHLGAGPAAADRAALVERMRVAIDEQIEYGYTAIALDFATVVMEVVEAAGWGPRAASVAGTGETLYRVCGDCGGSGEKAIVLQTHREVVGPCEPCIGVGFVPVAPPEPLSAGEIAAMEVAIVDADEQFSFIDVRSGESLARREVMAVLAALPARHAVPVEGA